MKLFNYDKDKNKIIITIFGIKITKEIKKASKLKEIKNQIKAKKTVKIIIGAGPTKEPGFIATQQEDLDLLNDNHWAQIPNNSVDTFLAEHVWEHLTLEDGIKAIRNCYNHLKPGGHIRIAIPDGYHPDKEYIEYVKPNGSGDGADDHKVLYNYEIVQKICDENNWNLNLLEYWDKLGNFHFKTWNAEDGMIYRSKNDKRNQNGELKYTSLIFDINK